MPCESGGQKICETRPFIFPLHKDSHGSSRFRAFIRRPLAAPKATLERGAPRSGGGKTDAFPALHLQGTYEEKGKQTIGPHLPHMKKKESRQSGPTFPGMGRYRRSRGIGCTISQGTHEADCQNALGTNEDIGKQELSLGRAPQRGERAHRFEESIISVCFPLKFPVASSHSSPLSLLRSQLPQGG